MGLSSKRSLEQKSGLLSTMLDKYTLKGGGLEEDFHPTELIYIRMCKELSASDPWRNGSASDSRSEGCVFDSRRAQLKAQTNSSEREE
ncbi:hypothetical protein DVH24_035817 [Malus domestica]|uniref:Uncharacterized protein n=1 Tax=Malus domestica TaxID=3750 RepID=A0A498JMH2_MALDO|nr:hypothetical protein DVH24_035817 [Malus domestica]